MEKENEILRICIFAAVFDIIPGIKLTLESRIIVPAPSRLLNFSIFFHLRHLYSIFTIVHRKDNEIVQSSTTTMNYVNTKQMLSL